MSEGTYVNCLKDFIKAFGGSLDPRIWASLIEEEANELREALEEGNMEHILKEACDLLYVQIGFNLTSAVAEQLDLFPDEERAEIFQKLQQVNEIHDEAMDKIPLVEKTLFVAFMRVHQSNMSKLGADGKPITREDGKILKGENYKPPIMSDLIKGVE